MMMKQNSTTKITEALGQGEFWKCRMNDCHLPFQSDRALGQHVTQTHAVYMVEGWEKKSRRLVQRWSERIEDTEESDMQGERNGPAEGERGREHEERAKTDAQWTEPIETDGQDEERIGEPNAETEREARTQKPTREATRSKAKRRARNTTLQKMGGVAKGRNGSRGVEFQKRSRFEDESRRSAPQFPDLLSSAAHPKPGIGGPSADGMGNSSPRGVSGTDDAWIQN
jgi:hypothetical protein